MSNWHDIPYNLVRAWTALYTRGLPASAKSERIGEIDSDLWEQRRHALEGDDKRVDTALNVLLRLVLGVPFDIAWRLETGAAIRSGRDSKMKAQSWTSRRWLSLLVALVILPVPMAWIAAGTRFNRFREESALSITMLALGMNVCALPIGLGVLTIFWEAPAFPMGSLAEGLAELIAGLAGAAGLYGARANLLAGLLLILAGVSAMAFLAPWALAAALVGGAALVVMAVVRFLAAPPPTPVAA